MNDTICFFMEWTPPEKNGKTWTVPHFLQICLMTGLTKASGVFLTKQSAVTAMCCLHVVTYAVSGRCTLAGEGARQRWVLNSEGVAWNSLGDPWERLRVLGHQATVFTKEQALHWNCEHGCYSFHLDCPPKVCVVKPRPSSFFMAIEWVLLLLCLPLPWGTLTGTKLKGSSVRDLPNCEPNINSFSLYTTSIVDCGGRWWTSNIFGSTKVRKAVSGKRNRMYEEQRCVWNSEVWSAWPIQKETTVRALAVEKKWIQVEEAWRNGLWRTWVLIDIVLLWFSE